MTKSNKKEGLTTGRKVKETLGCVVVGPSIIVLLLTALILIKCEASEIQKEDKSTKRESIPSLIIKNTPEPEIPSLSPERIQELLSQINEKIKPQGYIIIGYNIPEPRIQVTGVLQILPIKLEQHREILIKTRELYIDPVAGEVRSPIEPFAFIGVKGPDGRVTYWGIVNTETILKIDDRFTERERKIVEGRVEVLSSISKGLEDVLFVQYP